MRPKGRQKRVSVRRPEFPSIRVSYLEQPHRFPLGQALRRLHRNDIADLNN
jgi:hypothetical protein